MRSRIYQKRSSTTYKTTQLPELKSQPLRLYVGKGNNSSLIRRVMSTRKNWEEVGDSKHLFMNLRWQQVSKGFNFDNCVDTKVFRHALNHLEFHQELSNKELLFKNLCDYCEANKINVFTIVPVTFALNLADSNFDCAQNNFLKFYDQHLPPQLRSPGCKHWLNLPRKRIPGSRLDRRTNFLYCRPEMDPVYQSENSQYLWILKPAFSNRGNGISLFNTIENLEGLIKSTIEESKPALGTERADSAGRNRKIKTFRIREYSHTHPSSHSFIVQKYLERPLLIKGRKFDIRVWVLFTHEMKVYFYREGYLRTCSSCHSTQLETLDDIRVHLTNNAVQKGQADYGKFEEGNQLSFRALKSLVEGKGGSFDSILVQMKRVVKLTALSVRKKINRINRAWCFELFGYDFMMDEKMKPWLIEVNTNPCLEESSLILENLLPRMIDDTFKLTIDTIFKNSAEGKNSKYVLSNYQNDDNLWEELVDLKKF